MLHGWQGVLDAGWVEGLLFILARAATRVAETPFGDQAETAEPEARIPQLNGQGSLLASPGR
jgi:hypothetical protein